MRTPFRANKIARLSFGRAADRLRNSTTTQSPRPFGAARCRYRVHAVVNHRERSYGSPQKWSIGLTLGSKGSTKSGKLVFISTAKSQPTRRRFPLHSRVISKIVTHRGALMRRAPRRGTKVAPLQVTRHQADTIVRPRTWNKNETKRGAFCAFLTLKTPHFLR